MRKLSFLMLLLFGTIFSGCSNLELQTSDEEYTDEDTSTEEVDTELNENPKLKTTDEVSYATKTEFSKDVQHYAVIKNTGEVTADLSNVVITYTGKDGSVIAMDEVPYIAPYILKPNQEAYVMSSAIIDVEPEEFDKAEMTVSAIATGDNMVEMVDTSNTNMTIESEQTAKTSDVIVSGKVKNNLKDKTDIILIGGALYDEKDNLVATTFDKVESLLDPNQSVGFESSVQDVPMEALLKVKKHKTNASYYPDFE
ncbi:hypothetical protein C2I27_19350 [Priestia megaterium]|uniref:FxLYD domain-containing protein n=1 Tax=Priestia TaxID=2800373 RepID=UPI000D508A69|nr:FxLYD domain-containing protein [Priestia megaterium]MBU8852920.1 FxLYD domain-containing protein [Bacillus sp. FJAT-26377]PVC65468.1 hypothetical protein C2I27_19350 [Priestia megaterium]